jgi:hypothetical protein
MLDLYLIQLQVFRSINVFTGYKIGYKKSSTIYLPSNQADSVILQIFHHYGEQN